MPGTQMTRVTRGSVARKKAASKKCNLSSSPAIELKDDIVNLWRTVGDSEGLSLDADVARYLLSLYFSQQQHETRSGARCGHCNGPLSLVCISCQPPSLQSPASQHLEKAQTSTTGSSNRHTPPQQSSSQPQQDTSPCYDDDTDVEEEMTDGELPSPNHSDSEEDLKPEKALAANPYLKKKGTALTESKKKKSGTCSSKGISNSKQLKASAQRTYRLSDESTIEEFMAGKIQIPFKKKHYSYVSKSGSKNNYVYYMYSHYTCFRCGKVFVSKRDFKAHHASVHPDLADSEISKSQEGKDMKRPLDPKSIQILNEIKERLLFCCPHCNRIFLTKQQQKKHVLTHSYTVDEKGIHTCQICGKTFTKFFNLYAHKRIPKGKTKCTECGVVFTSWCQVKNHMAKHSEDKLKASHLTSPDVDVDMDGTRTQAFTETKQSNVEKHGNKLESAVSTIKVENLDPTVYMRMSSEHGKDMRYVNTYVDTSALSRETADNKITEPPGTSFESPGIHTEIGNVRQLKKDSGTLSDPHQNAGLNPLRTESPSKPDSSDSEEDQNQGSEAGPHLKRACNSSRAQPKTGGRSYRITEEFTLKEFMTGKIQIPQKRSAGSSRSLKKKIRIDYSHYTCFKCHKVFVFKRDYNTHSCTDKVTEYACNEGTELRSHDMKQGLDSELPQSERGTEKRGLDPKSIQILTEIKERLLSCCPHCDHVFLTKQQLKKHVLSHSYTVDEKGTHTCLYCGATFSKLSNLNSHVMIRKEKKECSECGIPFSSNCQVKKHMRTHRKEKCSICGASLAGLSRTEIKAHRHSHQDFLCPTCGKAFSFKFSLANHMKMHSDQRPYACTICNLTFKYKSILHGHMVCHGEKKVICELCGAKFFFPKHLKSHKNHVHNKTHVRCEECGATVTKDYLKVHMFRVHKQVRPHPCTLCTASFKTAYELGLHMPRHTGERPFHCEYCPAKFSRAHDIEKHVKKSHYGGRPHKCEDCDQVFSCSSSLMVHRKKHHRAARTCVCSHCGEHFVVRSQLDMHLHVVHGEGSPLESEASESKDMMVETERSHGMPMTAVTEMPLEMPGTTMTGMPMEMHSAGMSVEVPSAGMPGMSVEVPRSGMPVEVSSAGMPVEVPRSGILVEVSSAGMPVEMPNAAMPGMPIVVSSAGMSVEVPRSGMPMEVPGATVHQMAMEIPSGWQVTATSTSTM